MNVDDLIRGLRSTMPTTPSGLADRIVTAAIDENAAPKRRAPVSARTLVIGTSVVVAMILLVAVGWVLRDGGRPDPVPATPTIPPARVDWGQIVTLRLTPDPGITVWEMRERLETALAFRAYDHGAAGTEIVGHAGNTVQVRLPGAVDDGPLSDPFLIFLRLVIVDDDASVLASGPNVGALTPKAQDLITSASPVAYYVQVRQPTGEWSQPERQATREAAQRWRSHQGKDATTVLAAVPADAAVTHQADGTVRVIRPTLAVPSSAVRSLRRSGDRVTVHLAPMPESLKGHRVSAYVDMDGRGTYRDGMTSVGSGHIDESGSFEIPVGRYWSTSVARPDLGGQVERVAATAYGTRPSENSATYSAPPVWDRQFGGPPKGTRWILLAKGTLHGDQYALVGGQRNGRIIGIRLHNVTERYDASMNVPLIGRESNLGAVGREPCPPKPGTPLVTQCGGGGGGNGAVNGKAALFQVVYGRVQPGVKRISVRLAGVEQDAVIDGGWWFAHAKATADVGNDPMGMNSINIVSETVVAAWDADGNRVPVAAPEMLRE